MSLYYLLCLIIVSLSLSLEMNPNAGKKSKYAVRDMLDV